MDILQSCTEPHQICVCATNSCAVRILDDAGVDAACGSGFRYVKQPFAAEDVVESCVAMEHASWIISEEAENKKCSALPPDGGEGGSGGEGEGGSGGEGEGGSGGKGEGGSGGKGEGGSGGKGEGGSGGKGEGGSGGKGEGGSGGKGEGGSGGKDEEGGQP
ncbi:hypothetical protein WME73_15105 [Sorangium sp. So ce302]|uniref:hypothetical protein n=1 Tax=Sorangium sp. So ce302 TaxID=3133297 RepID=UPI003F608220